MDNEAGKKYQKAVKMDRRVVVTGLGINNCLGNSVNEFWDSLISLKNKIEKIKSFDLIDYYTFKAGQVKNIEDTGVITKKEKREIDRFALLALIAAEQAMDNSGIDVENINPCRIGVILGSGLGGMMFYEEQIKKFYESKLNNKEVHPNSVQKITPNALSGRLAMKFNCQGTNLVISTACSSSNHAIGIAAENIVNNMADIVITGGAEAPLMPVNFASFDNMRVMSRKNICRPFDLGRDGFVMGEGAAVLILEELESAQKRNAKIYAEIKGYGSSCGATHMVQVKEEGDDEARAINLALNRANIDAADIDYINAHGTGTISNDKSEARAIRKVFKKDTNKIFVSSNKGATGHLIGAGGATEAIATILAIQSSIIPPNANYKKRDSECDLNIAKEPIEKDVESAISNSFGFGNNNAVLVFGKFRK